jgi:CBS domain-containing protein
MDLKQPVSSIMTTAVVSVTPSQTLLDVKHIFEKKDFHQHIPVTDQGMLAGMISLKDYLYAIKGASISDSDPVYGQLTVAEVMSEHPMTCASSATIAEAGAILAKGDVHALVIADEGKVKGIVSTADMIRAFLEG